MATLLVVVAGLICFRSNASDASDFIPQLTRLWQVENVSIEIMKPTYQFSDLNILFANHHQPYTTYRNNPPPVVAEPFQMQQIDSLPAYQYTEPQTSSNSFDQPFRFQKITHTFLPMLWEDARDSVTVQNSMMLGVALGGAIAIRNNWDDNVRRYTARHPNRWSDGTRYLGKLGEPQYQVPAMLLLYSYSKYQRDSHMHDMSVSMLSAYTITALSTLAVKGIANTKRPSNTWNNGEYGFPSFHTSSSFAIAAVIEEYYGPNVGIPAYAVAGLIGWSRIDERDHDLGDVVFGAALGYIIGKAVSGKHRFGNSNVTIMPYFHPIDGTTGMMFEVPF